MKKSLSPETLHEIGARLEQAHKSFERRYPGPSATRQPVHVVYGGAHLFRSNIRRKLGELALRSLEEFAPDFVAFAKALDLAGAELLPDAPEAIAALASLVEADPAAARREN